MSNVYCISSKSLLSDTELANRGFKAPDKSPELSYSEIQVRLLARFGDNMPRHWRKAIGSPQKQPYRFGDPHNVQYRVKQAGFNKPMPLPCEVTVKSCKKFNGVLQLGFDCAKGIDEPFAWMDHKWQVSLNFLKSLPDGTELHIRTRSDLIAHDDYIAELKRLNVIVAILYCTKNEDQNRDLEPGAPSYKRRKIAFDKLKSLGVKSSMVRIDAKLKVVA